MSLRQKWLKFNGHQLPPDFFLVNAGMGSASALIHVMSWDEKVRSMGYRYRNSPTLQEDNHGTS